METKFYQGNKKWSVNLPVTLWSLKTWFGDSPKDLLNSYWHAIWPSLGPSYNLLQNIWRKFFSTPHWLSSARMKIKLMGDFLAASAWGWGWSVSRKIRRKKRKNVCGQGIDHRHSGSLSFLIQLIGRISFWGGGKSTYPVINRLEQRRKTTTMAPSPGFVPRPH